MNALAPRRRGALHAARQPGRDAGGAARRRADRRGARPARAGARPRRAGARLAPLRRTRSTRRGFALHHVVCQTLVRVLETPHAETNATMLPRAMEAMRDRAPEADRRRWRGAGHDARAGSVTRIEDLGGGRRQPAATSAPTAAGCGERSTRSSPGPSFGNTPDPPGRQELDELLGRLVAHLRAAGRHRPAERAAQ